MKYRSLIPPETLRTLVGPYKDATAFLESGQQTFSALKEYARLLPSRIILDAGCGCGRIALHLLDYLNDAGEYYGFDIFPEPIDWCAENISQLFHNFHFTHLDVKKKLYNPTGKFQLKEITLPYTKNMFDIICAHSLFTHMLPDEMEHYLCEFSRVIKRNGTFYASYYLMNDKTSEGVKKGTAAFNFEYRVGQCFTFDKENPEEGIAQIESFVTKVYQRHGFKIIEPIHYSDWDKNHKPDQDFIIAKLIA
jgi:SAM-dependent methyltransferase